MTRLGLYAALADPTPPRLQVTEDLDDQWRLSWTDRGSGIGLVRVSVDEEPMPVSGYAWDGEWLCIKLPSGFHHVTVQVTDRAGNQASAERATRRPVVPGAFSLGQNFPNPFNPSTTIPFVLPAAARVRLEIFSASGQRVRQLPDQALSPGFHELVWDARDNLGRSVSSGIYLYRLQLGDRAETRKMTLLR